MEKSLRVFSIRNSLHSFSHTFSMVLSDTGLVRKLRFWIMTQGTRPGRRREDFSGVRGPSVSRRRHTFLKGWRLPFFFCLGFFPCSQTERKGMRGWLIPADVDRSHEPLVSVNVKKVAVLGVSDIGCMNDLIFHYFALLSEVISVFATYIGRKAGNLKH